MESVAFCLLLLLAAVGFCSTMLSVAFACFWAFRAVGELFEVADCANICCVCLTSFLAAAGGPGAFGAFEVDIVPVALTCAPNALPVEFNADTLVPLELWTGGMIEIRGLHLSRRIQSNEIWRKGK